MNKLFKTLLTLFLGTLFVISTFTANSEIIKKKEKEKVSIEDLEKLGVYAEFKTDQYPEQMYLILKRGCSRGITCQSKNAVRYLAKAFSISKGHISPEDCSFKYNGSGKPPSALQGNRSSTVRLTQFPPNFFFLPNSRSVSSSPSDGNEISNSLIVYLPNGLVSFVTKILCINPGNSLSAAIAAIFVLNVKD